MAESVKIKFNNNWTGYKNFRDITNMEITDLAPGSQNTFIQDGDRLEVRAGTDYFGAQGTSGTMTNPYWSLVHRIHSKYDQFVNMQGIKVPIRVFYSGTTAQGDVMEAWLPIYAAGVATANKQWYRITANAPSVPLLSTHRYYFDEWWDPQNLQSQLVFTMGNTNIWHWTGGFANIVALTPTTIQTTPGVSWREKGFIVSPEGNATIVVNVAGVPTEVAVVGGFGTDTITVASTAGIVVDDVAFQLVDGNSTITGTTYDVCSTVNNQVYYIDWKQRNVYVSWDKNQLAYLGTQRNTSISGLNDGVYTGTYTGTPLGQGNGTYDVTIDSVAPKQEFISGGSGNLDDGVYDFTGYTQNGTENTYIVSMVGDVAIVTSANPIPGPTFADFAVGEHVYGSTTNAEAIVVYDDDLGAGVHLLGFKMLTDVGFDIATDTITGRSTQVTLPPASISTILAQDFIQLTKNGIVVNVNTGAGLLPVAVLTVGAPITLTDGLTIEFGRARGHTPGDSFKLIIKNSTDTFSWSFNGANTADNVPVSLAPTLLSLGISITFKALIGHALGDKWVVTAYPQITRGWTQFFFTADGRLPGQGARLLLDSNGHTMKPQEKTMYINADAGHYYTVDRKLSFDQLTEVLQVERLKSEPQNKVLYPYLIGYDKNQLASISQDKTYDSLGRQELLELPQTKSISDDIRIDFETADWEDGDFLYAQRKLFFVVPRSGLMFIWDDYKKYWHSPMKFARRVGLVSVIDGVLVGHSYERNESYELFTGTNDLEAFPIETRMVFAYDSFNQRYFQKTSSAVGFEGYILGAPDIFYRVNADVDGCNGFAEGKILPVLCLPQDRASLGKSHLGFHGLGNDPTPVIPHFFYIDTFDKKNYYQRNMELTCDSMDQRWSIISIGTDVDMSSENNTTIVHRKSI